MKKHLLGIIAIVLAITLNSFSFKSVNDNVKTTDYFWYEVVDDHIVSGPLNPTPIGRTSAKSLLGECDDDSGEVCLVGSLEDDETEGTPVEDMSDNLIYKP